MSEQAVQNKVKIGQACECGQSLPWHLFGLGMGMKHVCFCERRYKEVDGKVIRDGMAINPFARYDEAMTGIELIAAERERQVTEEGWTAEHDDQHGCGEMVEAAVAYARYGAEARFALSLSGTPSCWPWDADWWKPSTKIRSLVKAGALIAAEIERLQRLEGQ